MDHAEEQVRHLLSGYRLVRTNAAGGAKPESGTPAVQSLVSAVGGSPQPKDGWAEVARFAQLSIPAMDALVAHTDEEYVQAADVRKCLGSLLEWLT